MQNWYDDVILPKVWNEYLRRWDLKVPKKYPDTGVEFTLDFQEGDREVVAEMESNLNTEQSAISEVIPEGNYVSQYLGAFEAEGEAGEHILLSPIQINTDEAIAIHYNGEAWEPVQNVVVENGYVYGDLSSLSPIAVFGVQKDIYVAESAVIPGYEQSIVCRGHKVIVSTEETVVEKEVEVPFEGEVPEGQEAPAPTKETVEEVVKQTYLTSMNSGTKILLGEKPLIIGGTIDGTDLESSDIAIKGVELPELTVIGGSFKKDDDGNGSANIKQVNVYVENSVIRSITGSVLRVHTAEVNFTIKNSEIQYFIGASESTNKAVSADVNADVKDHLDKYAPNATEVVNLVFENSVTDLHYSGGNCGYTWIGQVNASVKNFTGKDNDGDGITYLLFCSSNGRVESVSAVIDGADCSVFTTVNRGYVGAVKAKVDNARFDAIYVAGDESDQSVTGTIDSITLDFGTNVTGPLFTGTNGGIKLTQEVAQKIIHYVKYSRSSNITIAAEDIDILGNKLIKK